MFLVSSEGVIWDVNQAFKNMMGYGDDIIGMTISEITPEEDLALTQKRFGAIQEGERAFNIYNKKYITKSGKPLPVQLSVSPIKDGEGKVIYHIVQLQDLTELREQEKQYHSLVENLTVGVYRCTGGPHGKFLQVNPAFLEIFNFSREEIQQIAVSDLYVKPEDRQRVSRV